MMEDMWKRMWAAYLVIVFLLVALFGVLKKAEQYHRQAEQLEQTICDLDQEVKQTTIRLNDSISLWQAEAVNLTVSQKIIRERYNKLLKASKTKPKDVDAISQISAVTHVVDTVVAMVDSFGGLRAGYADPFINIDVKVFSDRNTIIDYKALDSLTVISFQKRHSWLFGLIKWNELKGVKVINHNPKSTIRSLQTVDVME